MSDWKVSVAEILGRPGEYRDIRIERPISGIRTTLAELADAPVEADLKAESVVEGVLVTGRIRGAATIQCARCLKPLSSGIDLEVCELFVPPGADVPPEEDFYGFKGAEIDLEPMLRDAIALDLPLNPLCGAECRGMCARCGADLNAGECDCADDDVDPRWAELSALRERLESK